MAVMPEKMNRSSDSTLPKLVGGVRVNAETPLMMTAEQLLRNSTVQCKLQQPCLKANGQSMSVMNDVSTDG